MRTNRHTLAFCSLLSVASPCKTFGQTGPQIAQPDDVNNAQWDSGCKGTEKLETSGKGGHAYPFDVTRITNALKRLSIKNDVSVLVVDSGFTGYDEGSKGQSKNFPTTFFPASEHDDQFPSYSLGRIGDGGEEFWRWGHGTHVTGIVLGGMYGNGKPKLGQVDSPEVRKIFLQRSVGEQLNMSADLNWLRIFVARLQTENDDWDTNLLTGLSQNENIPAEFRSADIINMSIVHSPPNETDIPNFMKIPEQFPDSLLVVSAGNGFPEGELVSAGANGQYPAMSSLATNNLLVVGSHDSDWKVSVFSNYHPERVMIAAPGCRIMSWVSGDDDPKPLDGTSQAAAVVSFAATAVRSRWAAKPFQLRERLIISSTYNQSLAKGCQKEACVRWGSALDIEMALYLDVDVIEYCKDDLGVAGADCATRLVLGKVIEVPSALVDCQKSTFPRNALGVSRLFPSTGVRSVSPGKYQVIYQKHQAKMDAETLGTCDGDVPVDPKEQFIIRPLDDFPSPSGQSVQPDGAIPDAALQLPDRYLRLPARSVVRLVARSKVK